MKEISTYRYIEERMKEDVYQKISWHTLVRVLVGGVTVNGGSLPLLVHFWYPVYNHCKIML